MPLKNVFTIAPGAPFLECFVDALLSGKIVANFSRDCEPLALADATIYVPTQRAARALASELARALRRSATLLPRILPLGGLDAAETEFFFPGAGFEVPNVVLPQAAPDLWRRMQLARLIQTWAKTLRGAIISVDVHGTIRTDEREPCLVGTSTPDAWHLAGELARLIDELIIEDVGWKKLDQLALPEFDLFWRITLDFLNIAIEQWPLILRDHHFVDAARRHVMLVTAQIEQIATGRARGPLIAIGSTGTNRATARLLAALAAHPRGAVVLPGLDKDLDEATWTRIGVNGGGDPSFGHPQAALRRLLPILGVTRADVTELGKIATERAARARLISEALRPADSTELWLAFRASPAFAGAEAALSDVTLIEAGDEREEALALAVALREVLETPDATAALVTPDRDLARHVAAELRRFGIEIDDSAGETLNASAAGSLALRLLDAAHREDNADFVALLFNPMIRLGLTRDEILRRAPLFEIGVLRQERRLPSFPTVAEALAACRERSQETFAHPAQKTLNKHDWAEIADLLRRIEAALAPLKSLENKHDLRAWIGAHREALAAAVRGEQRARGEDEEALDNLFDELLDAQLPDLLFNAGDYSVFLAQLLSERVWRRVPRAHPRLKIFGLLEARLMPADVMLLAGLDEGVWPPQAQNDAFLNRPMREALGLTPPERRIGQTAHDFVMAMGHPRVFLSRAKKRDGTPMVESRFVQRLAALTGDRFTPCHERGERYLDLARALDQPRAETAAIKRPAPKPPLALRPQRLSVTKIEMLRRDPYAIYAEFCLKLKELPTPIEIGERRTIGTLLHKTLEEFGRRYGASALPDNAAAILLAMLERAFEEERNDPNFAAFAWPRLQAAIAFYLEFESRRRPHLTRIDVEAKGTLEIALGDGTRFTLAAIADRIEHHANGGVSLIDYKTGTPPGVNEVRIGFAPQLTLEAAMAARGAFGLAQGTAVTDAMYVRLFAKDGGHERLLKFSKPDATLAQIAEYHFAELVALLTQFRDPRTGYPARPYPKFAARYNAYDHLSRVKEWAAGREDSA